MIRHVLAIAALLALSACGSLGIPSPQSPADTVYAMRAAYDATFLKPAAAYNQIHRCPLPAPCSDAAVVDQLRKADASAKALLDGAEDVARNHPGLNVSTAISAAKSAISAAEGILTVYKIGAP